MHAEIDPSRLFGIVANAMPPTTSAVAVLAAHAMRRCDRQNFIRMSLPLAGVSQLLLREEFAGRGLLSEHDRHEPARDCQRPRVGEVRVVGTHRVDAVETCARGT